MEKWLFPRAGQMLLQLSSSFVNNKKLIPFAQVVKTAEEAPFEMVIQFVAFKVWIFFFNWNCDLSAWIFSFFVKNYHFPGFFYKYFFLQVLQVFKVANLILQVSLSGNNS